MQMTRTVPLLLPHFVTHYFRLIERKTCDQCGLIKPRQNNANLCARMTSLRTVLGMCERDAEKEKEKERVLVCTGAFFWFLSLKYNDKVQKIN